jgi:UPF0755 protein
LTLKFIKKYYNMKIKGVNIDLEYFKNHKRLSYSLMILLVVAIFFLIFLSILFFSRTKNNKEVEIFIYPTYNYEQVKGELVNKGVIKSGNFAFKTASKILSYSKCIKQGRYVVKKGTSVLKLVYRLRSGKQTPIKVVINSARTLNDLAKEVTKNLMMSENDFINEVNKQHFTYPTEVFYQIIPDTYEVYWTIKPKKLLDKLFSASSLWWKDKENDIKKSGLTKKEIIILASIVNEETNKSDEKSRIAGVYVNRVRKGMFLQADPTVKFAIGDFTIKRILHEHLTFDSPFNTYLHQGLPPAPICLPTLSSLKASLHYERHNFIYFCAKEDFSGYHNFASNDREHINNANRYRRELNKKGIK